MQVARHPTRLAGSRTAAIARRSGDRAARILSHGHPGSRRARTGLMPQAALVHPYEARGTPSAFMTCVTRREDGFSSSVVADLPPGLPSNVLVERVRMSDFRGDRFRAVCADGAQRCIRLSATRTALSWQGTAPALSAPAAVNSPGAVATGRPTGEQPWAIPTRRAGIGREPPSAGSAASRDHLDPRVFR
jgi:hypothetical protein